MKKQLRDNFTFASANVFSHRRAMLVAALLVHCLVGCQVYPQPCRKSLHEIYYEALAAAENTPDRAAGLIVSHGADLPAVACPPTELLPRMEEVPREADVSGSDELEPVPLLPPVTESETGHSKTGSVISSRWRTSGDDSISSSSKRNAVRRVSHATGSLPTKVTEFFEDTDIRQALQALAVQADATIIVDEQVGGVVNAVIEDEPLETALMKVLLPAGLVHRRISSGEYIVGIPDPTSPLFSKLSVQLEYRPLHLSPEELGAIVGEREQKFIQILESRNRILIEAPPEIAESIQSRLIRFDTPIPQVELEAIVCVVAPDSGFKSGLDWGHAVTLNGSELLNIGMSGLSLSGAAAGRGLTNAFTDFAVTSAFVKLLAQEGYLSIRAAPRVTARDGDQAKISITRESFFSTQPQSDSNFFRQEIETVEAGIQMDITPVIRGDNITVKIEKAEVSEDIRTSQISSSITENPFPQINRRTVSTTVHVKDGETIVIGGLVQRQVVDRIARVPVRGSIPGLGRVFQTVEQTEQDAEVIIFISPRLVRPSDCNAARSTLTSVADDT